MVIIYIYIYVGKNTQTKEQLYGPIPPFPLTIQVRWTKYNVFPRNLTVGWPIKVYLHHLCADTGCSLEDLLRVMPDRDKLQERERERERERDLRRQHDLIYILSSLCHAASTYFPDPLSPFVSLIFHFRQVLQTTSCVRANKDYHDSHQGTTVTKTFFFNLKFEWRKKEKKLWARQIIK